MRSALLSLSILLALCPLSLLAQPTVQVRDPIQRDFSEPERSFSNAMGKRRADARKETKSRNQSSCDFALASMPIAPTPLPPPSAGLALYHVAVGRGTQNYTCASSLASDVPMPIGAVAALYNASCIACTSPELLAMTPGISIKYAVPASRDTLAPANILLSGHHYFTDATTAFFTLDTDAHAWGAAAMRKLTGTPAPDPVANVPWLKLVAKDPSAATWLEVFRVNTAGGVPPRTCEGKEASFVVDYSAEYWMYAAV